jgi:chromate transporter
LGLVYFFVLFKSLNNLRRLNIHNFFPPLFPITLAMMAGAPFSLVGLFLIFLKIGSVLYGSGYVLLAFLRADFVERLGWLTDRQLLDAVAIGQFTPGPLFTTATFIGYILGGVPAALLASIGIFLPSFIFVLVSNPWIAKLRESVTASAFLDGVNASALALMAVVTWQLGLASIVDLPTIALALLALILLIRFRLNSAWLVLGGGAAGLFLSLLI